MYVCPWSLLLLWLSCVSAAVLRDVNLVLKQGTVTALVGRSGAGKSTVAALLSRFYEPQIGTIRLAGRPTSSFTRGGWCCVGRLFGMFVCCEWRHQCSLQRPAACCALRLSCVVTYPHCFITE